jgi:ribosomal protein RSM22 (predicted rRNA methylase)
MRYPGAIDEAVDRLVSVSGGLARSSTQLTETYRRGATSRAVDVRAYLAARVPATFAANQRVMEEMREVVPDFVPTSLLDIGAGPGTASWAAVASWPSLAKIVQCEQDASFAEVAQALNAGSGIDALQSARLLRSAERALPIDERADLVIASYMLAELPLEAMRETALRLWTRSEKVLLLIEPGTPQGFARLRVVRDVLLGTGAQVIAPCTHQLACPMAGNDWCHFKVRLARSRAHMHAKGAIVPFEDEPFSYLVLGRELVAPKGGRIIAPTNVSKIRARLRLCADGQIKDQDIAARDKPAYKRAKKVAWGERWE